MRSSRIWLSASTEFSGRPEFVAHVGKKMALQLGRSLQKISLVVQFRIERHDSTIGLVEFFVELRQLRLARAQFFQRAHQLFILLFQLFVWIFRRLALNRGQQRIQFRVDKRVNFVGMVLPSVTTVPLPGSVST